MTRLGEKIKELRLEKKLTLSKLAEIANVGQSTINDIESGKAKNPKTDTLAKLANALSVSVNELILENWDDVYNENDKLKNEVELLESIRKTYGKQSVELLEEFLKLNSKGKDEAIKRIYELTIIPIYSKINDNVTEITATKGCDELKPIKSFDEVFTTVAAHYDELTDKEMAEADRRILEDINKRRLQEFKNNRR